VFFEGYDRAPLEDLPKSKNPFELCAPKFVVENGIGCFNDGDKFVPFQTSRGVCVAPTLKTGVVS